MYFLLTELKERYANSELRAASFELLENGADGAGNDAGILFGVNVAFHRMGLSGSGLTAQSNGSQYEQAIKTMRIDK